MMNITEFAWQYKYCGLLAFCGFTVYKLFSQLLVKNRLEKLKGKVVVITGASSGIGEALAHAFFDLGCTLVLAARRESELNRVKEDLLSKKTSALNPEVIVIRLDLENLDSIEPFVEKVYNACGHIDILINNGGISHRGSIIETVCEVHKRIMYINYFGSVYLTKAVLPKMIERRDGHIIFISSIQGRIAIPFRSAYAASKHALQAFGDSLRAEVHQHNIAVSVVSPGYIKTNVSLNALSASGDKHGEMDVSTATGFTAEYLASEILGMTANKDNELIVSQFLPKIGIFIRYQIPSLYFWFMNKRAKDEAK